jgi:hypothetical protein
MDGDTGSEYFGYHIVYCYYGNNTGDQLVVVLSGLSFVGRYASPFLRATKALRESRGIAVHCFIDLGTRLG